MTATRTEPSPSNMPQAGDPASNAGRSSRHIGAVGLSPRTEHNYVEQQVTRESAVKRRGVGAGVASSKTPPSLPATEVPAVSRVPMALAP